jgi:hypothetical protein
LLHESATRNHISLNSLGLPFAQLLAIESAARKAIRDGTHAPADIYMDENFFRSLRLAHGFDKRHRVKHAYVAPMAKGEGFYFLERIQTLLDGLQPPEERF